MARGDRKTGEGTEELGTTTEYTKQGGGSQESVGELLKVGGSTGTAVWGRDLGGDAKNGAGVELFHAWGRETDHGDKAA